MCIIYYYMYSILCCVHMMHVRVYIHCRLMYFCGIMTIIFILVVHDVCIHVLYVRMHTRASKWVVCLCMCTSVCELASDITLHYLIWCL